MITVWHNPNFIMTGREEPSMEEFIKNDCEPVANVYTDDLEEAYRLTNTIDTVWWENKGVDTIRGGYRSTSMGDYMDRDGVVYQVAAVGFVKVGELVTTNKKKVPDYPVLKLPKTTPKLVVNYIEWLREDRDQERDARHRLERYLDKRYPGWQKGYDNDRLLKAIKG